MLLDVTKNERLVKKTHYYKNLPNYKDPFVSKI